MNYFKYKDIKDTYKPKVNDIIMWVNREYKQKYKFLLITKVFSINQVVLTTIPCINGYNEVYCFPQNTITQFAGVEGQVFIIC